jgi:hypothetical protein
MSTASKPLAVDDAGITERRFVVDDVARVKTLSFARSMAEDAFSINKISRNHLNATRSATSYDQEQTK